MRVLASSAAALALEALRLVAEDHNDFVGDVEVDEIVVVEFVGSDAVAREYDLA